jgi:hypothetical protein
MTDHVIPRVPVRPWVLSFPIPVRLLRLIRFHGAIVLNARLPTS